MMNLTREQLGLHIFADTSGNRDTLASVCVDPCGLAVAANGRSLCMVSSGGIPETNENEVPLPANDIAVLADIAGKKGPVSCGVSDTEKAGQYNVVLETEKGTTSKLVLKHEYSFPAWRNIMPTDAACDSDEYTTFAINPFLLAEIVKFVCDNSGWTKQKGLKERFNPPIMRVDVKNGASCIRFSAETHDGQEIIAVLMPIMPNKEK